MRQEPFFRIQLRVLFAMVMREMSTRYGRTAGGYLWAVLEPAGTVALLSLVFTYIARRPALGESFPVFFATGYMAFHVYVDISRNVGLAVQFNRPLLSFPRVTIIDAILSRFILHLITAIFVSTIVIGGAILIWEEPVRLDFGPIFLAVGLAALLGLAVGAFNCVAFAWSTVWERTFGILNRPLFLVSGAFFLWETLPRELQAVAWWNPLVHVTGLMRRGFYPAYEATFASPLFVVLFAAPFIVLTMLLLPVSRSRMLEP